MLSVSLGRFSTAARDVASSPTSWRSTSAVSFWSGSVSPFSLVSGALDLRVRHLDGKGASRSERHLRIRLCAHRGTKRRAHKARCSDLEVLPAFFQTLSRIIEALVGNRRYKAGTTQRITRECMVDVARNILIPIIPVRVLGGGDRSHFVSARRKIAAAGSAYEALH
jgi:hypothetical protein